MYLDLAAMIKTPVKLAFTLFIDSQEGIPVFW